ncbi:MAG: hypothetical protein ABEK42_02530 [Thiohalorhabdaceae bacterium]
MAWAFALPVVLPLGLLLIIPGLWRDSQVMDKLAGFGSRLVVFALAFHLFLPLAGSAADALSAFLPVGEAVAGAQASPGAAESPADPGAALRGEGVALVIQAVAVPVLVLWLLGWGLRRLGRPLGRIHPPQPVMDEADEAD